MRGQRPSRYATALSVAAALLAACGGSQSPIGGPGTTPQSRAIVQHAGRGNSWMLADQGQALVRVSSSNERR